MARKKKKLPKWARKPIFVLTGLRFDWKTGATQRQRTWGWYPTRARAVKAAQSPGWYEMGYYEVMLVERVTAAWCACCAGERWWFRMRKGGKIEQIGEPKCFKHIINFGIG